MTPRKYAAIMFLLFLLFWSSLAVGVSKYWFGAIPVIVFVVVPVAATVGWRTYTLHRRNGITSKDFLLDGFIWGSLVSLLYAVIQAFKLLGNDLKIEDEEIFSFAFLRFACLNLAPVVLTGGLLGVVHGWVAAVIRRFFDKPANQSHHSQP